MTTKTKKRKWKLKVGSCNIEGIKYDAGHTKAIKTDVDLVALFGKDKFEEILDYIPNPNPVDDDEEESPSPELAKQIVEPESRIKKVTEPPKDPWTNVTKDFKRAKLAGFFVYTRDGEYNLTDDEDGENPINEAPLKDKSSVNKFIGEVLRR